jgi:hypothetical protein
MRTSHIGSEFEDVVYPESPKPWRTHDYLNYWLNCPAATMSCFKIMRNGKAMGYFLSSRVGRQMRIADIRVASDDVADWTSAYTLAANTAAGEADVCEISAAGSTALSRKSLLASGFRDRGAVPLFLHGSNTILNRIDSIFWNMIDGDAAYLSDPSHPYVT